MGRGGGEAGPACWASHGKEVWAGSWDLGCYGFGVLGFLSISPFLFLVQLSHN